MTIQDKIHIAELALKKLKEKLNKQYKKVNETTATIARMEVEVNFLNKAKLLDEPKQ